MINPGDYIQLANIKPCPFCHDQPILEYTSASMGWDIGCYNIYCMFQPNMTWYDPHELIDMWCDRSVKKLELR